MTDQRVLFAPAEASPDLLERMKTMYESGSSFIAIAEEVGMSYSWVKKKLNAHGVKSRPVGSRGLTPEQRKVRDDAWVARYAIESTVQIAKGSGYTEAAVAAVLRKRGVRLRQSWKKSPALLAKRDPRSGSLQSKQT